MAQGVVCVRWNKKMVDGAKEGGGFKDFVRFSPKPWGEMIHFGLSPARNRLQSGGLVANSSCDPFQNAYQLGNLKWPKLFFLEGETQPKTRQETQELGGCVQQTWLKQPFLSEDSGAESQEVPRFLDFKKLRVGGCPGGFSCWGDISLGGFKFYVHPDLGKIWRSYLSDGLRPPTRWCIIL